MLEFRILEGSQAGTTWVARHFPVRVGRDHEMDLQLTDPGVWDAHAEIDYDQEAGFILQPLSGGAMYVNEEPSAIAPLKNGDIFQLGDVILQVWLTTVAQRRLVAWESCLWLGLAMLIAGQALLIVWLTR